MRFDSPAHVIQRALELARLGRGHVEPNPMVGAVVVDDELNLIGEGYHQQYGGPHAEVHALAAAGDRARGATLYCTLEPCCHFGKTPPCSQAVIAAGIRKVVAATGDPAPHVAGGGFEQLRQAGIEVEVGLLGDEARAVIAPFVKQILHRRPWVHGKWAMTLDGKIATRTGHSQWISGAESRQVVHDLRGKMDAVIVGSRTALVDDPLLTARPPGPRTATRIVLDTHARLSVTSRLVGTAGAGPVVVAAGPDAPSSAVEALRRNGVEVLSLPLDEGGHVSIDALLAELGQRRMTHVLVEGGGEVLGACLDRNLLDEVHVFIAPKLVGGRDAPGPIGGTGLPRIPGTASLTRVVTAVLAGDVYVNGLIDRAPPAA